LAPFTPWASLPVLVRNNLYGIHIQIQIQTSIILRLLRWMKCQIVEFLDWMPSYHGILQVRTVLEAGFLLPAI